MTIFAARRVVPPDFTAEAARSLILRKLMTPEATPPPETFSPSARRELKFVPVPEPYLKMRASRVTRSKMPPSFSMSSLTDSIEQACVCVFLGKDVGRDLRPVFRHLDIVHLEDGLTIGIAERGCALGVFELLEDGGMTVHARAFFRKTTCDLHRLLTTRFDAVLLAAARLR